MSADTINNGGGQVPAPADDLRKHQYLKEMRYQKGGYAILMAFHRERQRRGVDFQGPLLKREILTLAQVRDVCAAAWRCTGTRPAAAVCLLTY